MYPYIGEVRSFDLLGMPFIFQYQAVVDTGTIHSIWFHPCTKRRTCNNSIFDENNFYSTDIQNPTYANRPPSSVSYGSVPCRQDLTIPPEAPRPTDPLPTTPDFVGPPGPPGPTVSGYLKSASCLLNHTNT